MTVLIYKLSDGRDCALVDGVRVAPPEWEGRETQLELLYPSGHKDTIRSTFAEYESSLTQAGVQVTDIRPKPRAAKSADPVLAAH